MPSDLTVAQGTTVTLDETPPPNLVDSLRLIKIGKLNDLVGHGIIGSAETVNHLLDTTKKVTRSALTDRGTFVPSVRVPNTTRPDLRRYGSYSATAANVSPTEKDAFWRVAREIDPHALENVTPDTNIHPTMTPAAVGRMTSIVKYLFADVTIESNATLTVAATVQQFTCGNLLIERGGRIIVQGSGLSIKAFSIQGMYLPQINIHQPIHR